MSDLATSPKRELDECKVIIRGGLGTFVEVGLALKRVRDKRLFEQDGFEHFKDWCEVEFQIAATYAKYHIYSAEVMDILSGHHGDYLPTNERVARPLGRLRTILSTACPFVFCC